jgi:putative thioredoxin
MPATARGPAGGEPGDWIRDVGDAEFESAVVAPSRERPVVVDFWAPWCGPCRALGPLLERLAEQHAGAFVLARVNVDEAPETARRFAVRSIPTVVGVRDGAVVAEFVGAQPEPVVRQFLTALLPSEADGLAREAGELAAAGHANAAEERFRAALEREARHGPALVGLARILAERGEVAEALGLLDRVAPTEPMLAEAERLAAELRTREAAEEGGGEADARARLAASPDDLQARLDLGRALAARRRYEEALGELLEVVRRDRAFADEAARKAMLDVFELLGSDDPLTERYRAELARVLFR